MFDILILILLVIYIEYYILLVKKFNFDYFPKNARIHRTLFLKSRNYFDLQYPTWAYSNKDGTCDKRRKDNAIIYKKSKIFVDGYSIVSKNPIVILEILYYLRIEEVDIEKNQLEIKKYRIDSMRKRGFII